QGEQLVRLRGVPPSAGEPEPAQPASLAAPPVGRVPSRATRRSRAAPVPGDEPSGCRQADGAVVGLPRLPRESWPPIYAALSEYTRTHPFNLTQCTSWCRDRLREQGLAVSRNSISYVARGATYGGCPLYCQPPPTAEEIREAFIGYVLEYAESADAPLTDEEVAEVRDWLGADEEASGPSAVGGHPDGGAVA